MAEWNHVICDNCWAHRKPNQVPIRLIDPSWKFAVFVVMKPNLAFMSEKTPKKWSASMYQPYEDILSRLGTPLWWDENGVPRYEPFHPSLCADIYADYAALLHIKCQGCGLLFAVASSWGIMQAYRNSGAAGVKWDKDGKNGQPAYGLPEKGNSGDFSYGDAPWHMVDHGQGGQCSGTTMTTDVVAVVEFWGRNLGKLRDWERIPQHEFKY